jgi:MFS family permease
VTNDAAPAATRLFTYEFSVLTLAAGFGFCNIAIFYGFATYLERLGVDAGWRGVLLGAEPLAAFCLRPFLSVLVTPRNALALARLSLVAMGLALGCYQLAREIPWILAVRLFHGVAFVCLVSAVTTMLSRIIPRSLSGRAFGYFSLSALVPYAVMPPLMEWLIPRLGGEDVAYAVCSALIVPALALLVPLGPRLGRRAMAEAPGADRPALAEVGRNLADPAVRRVLGAGLCLFLSTTLVFFYMKAFALGLGLTDPGLFFTVSTVASILVRLTAGRFYDRLPKVWPLLAALVALAGCMAGFAATRAVGPYLLLAAGYGACLGVAMPLVNAVLFERSPAALRGVNMNLMLFMMDAGYVAGPMLGGAMLAAGTGYPVLFGTCAGFALAAGLLVWSLAVGRPAAVRTGG